MSRCVKNPPASLSSRAVSVRHCKEADAEHRKSFRQYAHTFHYSNTICLCSAFESLSEQWQLAIFLHEIGHLLAGYEASEADANRAIELVTNIKIHYKDGHFGKKLEWISREDVSRAKKALFGKARA